MTAYVSVKHILVCLLLLRVCRGRWAITCNDAEFGGQGNKDTGDDFWGAPDLDHTNPHLREALVHWLQHLRDNIGYRGWRFDFAKVCCMSLLECVLGTLLLARPM